MYSFLIIGSFLKCATAKIAFEKSKVSQGFEALARAQCLLRSKSSLGKITLLSQVISLFLCLLLQINRFILKNKKREEVYDIMDTFFSI